MWILCCLIVVMIILMFCHFKLQRLYTISRYQISYQNDFKSPSFKTISNSIFNIYKAWFLNHFKSVFQSTIMYINIFLSRMRNLIKRLSKTSGMKRSRLLCRLILGLVRLKTRDNSRVETYNLFVNIWVKQVVMGHVAKLLYLLAWRSLHFLLIYDNHLVI